MLPLYIHIPIHILLSLTGGYIGWRISPKMNLLIACLAAGIIGGVLIDVDHFFDHFMAYGLQFNPRGFISGTHFIINNKIYVPFHGYEYVLILFIMIYCLYNRLPSNHNQTSILVSKTKNIKLISILLSFTLAMLFHLLFDVYVNDMPWQSYSILYRLSHNFDAKVLNKPKNYLQYYNQ